MATSEHPILHCKSVYDTASLNSWLSHTGLKTSEVGEWGCPHAVKLNRLTNCKQAALCIVATGCYTLIYTCIYKSCISPQIRYYTSYILVPVRWIFPSFASRLFRPEDSPATFCSILWRVALLRLLRRFVWSICADFLLCCLRTSAPTSLPGAVNLQSHCVLC